MAPRPLTDALSEPKPTTHHFEKRGLGTASIVSIVIFTFFSLTFIITSAAWWYHKRAERNKLPPEKRPVSYQPWRTESYESSLLKNAAPSPEDDKSSMFSRDRNSSLSLYVDTETHDRRASMETASLIPLHVTPVDEAHDPMDRKTSVGSGVSGLSRYSRGSLAPEVEGEGEDLGLRKTRPRSTSATSTRYYEVTPTDVSPQIPKIVHTPSA